MRLVVGTGSAASSAENTHQLAILEGGGATGALMRAHDWSNSPLGWPESWPQSLRAIVTLLLHSGFPMFVAWGKDLGFLYNDPYAQILGAKHPRSLGARFYDIWSEIWPDISPLIDAALAGEATYREDLPLVMNRKGFDEQTWFTFSYSPVKDESGKIAGMFCAVSETTQKILAERRLRESEGRFRALVTASSYAIYRMSPDWSEMRALEGQGFLADTQSPSESWLGNYIHPDDQPQLKAAIRVAIETKSVFELEHRVRRLDGTLGWTLSKAVPFLDANGEIIEWFGAASDVTDRVASAHAERKLLADIVELTDLAVIVADLDHRLRAINEAGQDAFETIFGARPKVGDSLLDLLADRPEHQTAVRAVWDRALAGEEFTATAEFGDPLFARRFYDMRFRTLRDGEGRRIGAYQFAQDVTERLREQDRLKKAEEALRQSQKLESIGQLTGGVAHDFNNLLAVISGGLQMLERHDDPERRQVILAGMRHAVERGTSLTRQLLAFSRRRPVNPEAIDLTNQITDMREMLNRSLRGDVQVEMKFDADLWPVEVDAGELELAILNLCVNARDAMPNGGIITIEAANVREPDGQTLPGSFVRLAVSDTGVGMTADVLARAFEPFFTTKEIGQGSGLGLAQIYGFATQSGGRVGIDSKPTLGTKVTLLLPRSHKQPLPKPESLPMSAASRPTGLAVYQGQALVVEDDNEVAALAVEMLNSIGFEVMRVASATAALGALANDRPFHIVFSDIMMPGGMSGLELAREINRRRPALPIVLTTGYAGAAAGASAEGFGLLLKPYSLEALAQALLSQIKRQSQGNA